MHLRVIIAAVSFLGWSAQAEAEPELVVLGAHLTEMQDLEPSKIKLPKAFSSIDGFEVVGVDEAQLRLRGVGPRLVSQALQGRAMTLLSEGRVLFEHADMEAARDRIAEAVAAFEQNLAASIDNRGLIDALLVQGNIALAMGDPSTASKAYKRVVRIDPIRELDGVSHPPKVIQLFSEVRRQVLEVPSGSILIEGLSADASVHLDGRFYAVGERTINDIPPGDHHVLISSKAGLRSHGVVQVRPGQQSVFQSMHQDFFIGPAADTEAGRERQIRAIYGKIGNHLTEGFVLIAGETGVDEVGLQLYESRTGNFSSVLRRPSDGDALSGLQRLIPELRQLRQDDGSLSHTSVSQGGLGLSLGTNPLLAYALFAPVKAERAPTAVLTPAVAGQSSPSAMPEKRKAPVPWYIWAGAGAIVVGATTTALLLSSSPEQEQSKPLSTGTGSVVVRF